MLQVKYNKPQSDRRYETCAGCGEVYNVSIYAPKGRYLCPVCRAQKKKG